MNVILHDASNLNLELQTAAGGRIQESRILLRPPCLLAAPLGNFELAQAPGTHLNSFFFFSVLFFYSSTPHTPPPSLLLLLILLLPLLIILLLFLLLLISIFFISITSSLIIITVKQSLSQSQTHLTLTLSTG